MAQKNLALRSREERIQMVDWEDRELSIKTEADLLGINRPSMYYL